MSESIKMYRLYKLSDDGDSFVGSFDDYFLAARVANEFGYHLTSKDDPSSKWETICLKLRNGKYPENPFQLDKLYDHLSRRNLIRRRA